MTNEQLTVSIDRGAKSWAIFDERDNVIFGFRKYTDEKDALVDAFMEAKSFSSVEPKVVYPFIKSMRITTSRSRK